MNCLVSIILGFLFLTCSQCELTEETKSATWLANDEFALDLLKKLPIKKTNQFFSSFSISTALAMTSLGARSKTLKQINKALHFDEVEALSSDEKAVHKIYKHLLQEYEKESANYTLDIANRLFVQKQLNVLETFLEETNDYYNASVEEVDFGSGKAEDIINHWVATKTHQKIKKLYPEDFFKDDTVLVLANAVYFKGEWITEFEKSKTAEEEFHVLKNSTSIVKMMKTTSYFAFVEDRELNIKAIKLPYKGNHLSMFIILPEQGELDNFVSQLNAEKLRSIIKQMRFQKVIVKLPKFKLEVKYSLNKILKKLKIKDLFSFKANLDGISNTGLYVNSIVHKTYVDVNEKGTEAAAATGIEMFFKSNLTPLPKTFTADKPFFFAIIDDRFDNLMLFTGTVIKP